MKRRLPANFDDLIANRYGRPHTDDEHPDERLDHLLTRYYGMAAASAGSTALALCRDDGEILPQSRRPRRGEYAVQRSTEPEAWEEYVVDRAALATAASFSTLTEAEAGTEAAPFEEYLVDVRHPLEDASAPAPRPASAAPTPETPPAPPPRAEATPAPAPRAKELPPPADRRAPEAAMPPADERRAPPQPAKPVPAGDETSRATATNDDFMADLQSILTGQKVFDPRSKTTVGRDQLDRPPVAAAQSEGPPVPAPTDGQAIFDRIAQSMQYANAYDLGTVELENRFADFDRTVERDALAAAERRMQQQQRAAERAVAGAQIPTVPAGVVPPLVPTVPARPAPARTDRTEVGTDDFIADIDAMRGYGAATPGAALPAAALPAMRGLPPATGWGTGAETGAYSFSASGQPAPTNDQIVAQIDAQNQTAYGNYAGYLGRLRSGTVFGHQVSGLTPGFLAKLQQVESAAAAALGHSNFGLQSISGYRAGGGMHNWGLAVDINYHGLPYLMHERGEVALDRELEPVYQRIAWLILNTGSCIPRDITQGSRSTARTSALYDRLLAESNAMIRYFQIMQNPAEIVSLLQALPPGFLWQQVGFALAPVADALQTQMMADYVTLSGRAGPPIAGKAYPAVLAVPGVAGRPFATSQPSLRAPELGYMNIHKEIVMALSGAGLRWGAIDFGGESGDIMHFDDRLGEGQMIDRATHAAAAALAGGG